MAAALELDLPPEFSPPCADVFTPAFSLSRCCLGNDPACWPVMPFGQISGWHECCPARLLRPQRWVHVEPSAAARDPSELFCPPPSTEDLPSCLGKSTAALRPPAAYLAYPIPGEAETQRHAAHNLQALIHELGHKAFRVYQRYCGKGVGALRDLLRRVVFPVLEVLKALACVVRFDGSCMRAGSTRSSRSGHSRLVYYSTYCPMLKALAVQLLVSAGKYEDDWPDAEKMCNEFGNWGQKLLKVTYHLLPLDSANGWETQGSVCRGHVEGGHGGALGPFRELYWPLAPPGTCPYERSPGASGLESVPSWMDSSGNPPWLDDSAQFVSHLSTVAALKALQLSADRNVRRTARNGIALNLGAEYGDCFCLRGKCQETVNGSQHDPVHCALQEKVLRHGLLLESRPEAIIELFTKYRPRLYPSVRVRPGVVRGPEDFERIVVKALAEAACPTQKCVLSGSSHEDSVVKGGHHGIALLKVDIDNGDCDWVRSALRAASRSLSFRLPLLVHVEVNPIVPPPFAYSAHASSDGSPICGPDWSASMTWQFCTLAGAVRSVREASQDAYALLGVEAGNAVFCRRDALSALEDVYPGITNDVVNTSLWERWRRAYFCSIHYRLTVEDGGRVDHRFWADSRIPLHRRSRLLRKTLTRYTSVPCGGGARGVGLANWSLAIEWKP